MDGGSGFPLAMTKSEIRKEISKILKDSKDALPELSEKICRKVMESEVYKTASVVLAYMALPDEVDLSLVIDDALVAGKKVFIPRIVPGTNLMDFFQVTDGAKAGVGSYGILEPQEDWPKFEFDRWGQTPDLKEQILVLTPGRAFTLEGARLGRGKGFYDNFFGELKKWPGNVVARPSVCIAGVCFGCQVVKELPVEAHDVQMDVVFTV